MALATDWSNFTSAIRLSRRAGNRAASEPAGK